MVQNDEAVVVDFVEAPAKQTSQGTWSAVTESTSSKPPQASQSARCQEQSSSDSDAAVRRRGTGGRRHDSSSDSSDSDSDSNVRRKPPVTDTSQSSEAAELHRRRRHDSDLSAGSSDSDPSISRRPSTSRAQFETMFADESATVRSASRARSVGHLAEHQRTVYRDSTTGTVIDAEAEYQRNKSARDAAAKAVASATAVLSQGSTQLAAIQHKLEEEKRMQTETFARSVGSDKHIEDDLKAALREGDPMAEYIAAQQRKENESSGSAQLRDGNRVSKKPKYTGPAAKPNRFHIQPGYRWDAVDRGNGTEQLVLAAMIKKQQSLSDPEGNREM
eukprot:GSChrysophyteH1.ASY1.ANO1.3329.1 assembled CDS